MARRLGRIGRDVASFIELTTEHLTIAKGGKVKIDRFSYRAALPEGRGEVKKI